MKAYVLLVVVVVAVFSLAIGGCEALLGGDSDEDSGSSDSNGTDTDTGIDDGTGDDGTAGDDGIPIDAYADLRSQAESSGYATDGDVTCYYDCYYDALFCGQQNGGFPEQGSTLDGSDDGGTEPLTSVEQQLVGKWARYHAYDESYRFRVYYADRTGCEFEISSNGYRSGEVCYVNWELNSLGSNVYAIERTSTTGGTYTGSYDCNCD